MKTNKARNHVLICMFVVILLMTNGTLQPALAATVDKDSAVENLTPEIIASQDVHALSDALSQADPSLDWNTFMGTSGIDVGYAIAVDGSDNIYIAGRSEDSWGTPVTSHAGGSDAFIAKLSSSGVLQWHTFLGGSGSDRAVAIALDSLGNIFVSGFSDGTWGSSPVVGHAGGSDVFVAKLTSGGAFVWNTFMGTAGDDHTYAGLMTDTAGNVYVTGESDATWGSPVRAHAGGLDAFAAKLNTNGALQWNTFLGSSSAGDEYGASVFVDGSGNVFVGGTSVATWGTTPVNAHAGGSDGFVAELNTNGTLQWNTFFGSSGADWGGGITLDSGGNIYAAGESDGTWGSPVRAHAGGNDFYVVKLDSSGVRQWNTFLGSSGEDYSANGASIAVDGSGNTFVTGVSAAAWGSPVDEHSGANDAFAAKLDSSGSLLWNTFMGSLYDDVGVSIVLDSSGNSNVIGGSWGDWGGGTSVNEYSGSYEAFVAQLNSSGTFQWNTFLGNAGIDGGYEVKVDNSGNVYVAGSSNASWGSPINNHTGDGTRDIFVAKFDSSGNLLWNTFLGGTGVEGARGLALDDSGNIFLSGNGDDTWGSSPVVEYAGGTDVFVAKLNSSGVLQWNTFMGSTSEDNNYGALDVDASYVYIGGVSDATWGTSPVNGHSGGNDAFVAMLANSTGILQWHTFLGSSVEDGSLDITLDNSNNIYLAGYSFDTWGGSPIVGHSGNRDGFVAKLNNSGVLQWNTFMGSTAEDWGGNLVLDSSSNIYVVGESNATWGSPLNPYAGDWDVSVSKLNSSGVLQWLTFLGSSATDHFWNSDSIQIDNGGYLYVTGGSNSTWGYPAGAYTGGDDGFAAKLNNNGALLWNTFLGGPADDTLVGSALDGSGNLHVTGYSWDTWGTPVNDFTAGREAFAAKYMTSLPSVGSIVRASANPTSAASVDFTVTFSEAVTGVTTDDFTFTKTGSITGYSVTGVSPIAGPADTYTVTVNTGKYNGTLRLDVKSSGTGIKDQDSLDLTGGYTSGEAYTITKNYKTNLKSSGAQDGWVLESGEFTNMGGTLNAGASTLRLGDDFQRKQYRSILSFTTKGLPNKAVITKVTLKVKKQSVTPAGTNPLAKFQGFMADMRKGFFGGAPGLALNDFQVVYGSRYKTYGPFKPALVKGWYSLNLTNGKGIINKLAKNGGVTQIRLRFKLDDNNDAANNYLSLFSGNAVKAKRPKLIVEYYVP